MLCRQLFGSGKTSLPTLAESTFPSGLLFRSAFRRVLERKRRRPIFQMSHMTLGRQEDRMPSMWGNKEAISPGIAYCPPPSALALHQERAVIATRNMVW